MPSLPPLPRPSLRLLATLSSLPRTAASQCPVAAVSSAAWRPAPALPPPDRSAALPALAPVGTPHRLALPRALPPSVAVLPAPSPAPPAAALPAPRVWGGVFLPSLGAFSPTPSPRAHSVAAAVPLLLGAHRTAPSSLGASLPVRARVRLSPAALRALRPASSPLGLAPPPGPPIASWRLVPRAGPPSAPTLAPSAPARPLGSGAGAAPPPSAAVSARAFDAALRRRARVIAATLARARAALAAHASAPPPRAPFPADVDGLALQADAFRARFRRRLRYARRGHAAPAASLPRREFCPRGLAPSSLPAAVASVARAAGLDPHVVATAASAAAAWRRPPPYSSPPPGSCHVPSSLSLAGILALGAPLAEEAALVSLVTRGASTLASPPRCRAWRDNHPSAYAHAHVVDELVAEHLRRGWLIRVTDLYRADPLLPVLVSPMAVVPKSTPGKFRLIFDGSSSAADCVNDFSHTEAVATPRLASFDDIVDRINSLRDADPHEPILLITTDFADAYKSVPVRADDWWQLAQAWRGEIYWNVACAFGLRASGHHLYSLTRAFDRRVAELCGNPSFTYVDDSMLPAYSRDAPACRAALESVPTSCGMSLSSKAAGPPATRSVFCGWLFDTDAMTVSLPAPKLLALRADVARLVGLRRVRRSDLVALLGALYAAARAVRHSRAYLSTLQEALSGASGSWVSLSPDAQEDVAHWTSLLDSYTGVSFMRLPPPAATVFSDACTSHGYGWVCHGLRLFGRGTWASDEPALIGVHINALELAAGIWAAHAVANLLPVGAHVALRLDNTTAVGSVKRGQGAGGPLEHALRNLALLRDTRPFSLSPSHLQGSLNVYADALSRGRLPPALASYTEVRAPAHSLTAICSSRRQSQAPATARG